MPRMWIVGIVFIAWLYVASLMAIAEAVSTSGSLLGAVFTFVLYGAGPMALVLYLLNTPARRRAQRAMPLDEASSNPDGSAHAARNTRIAPERKES